MDKAGANAKPTSVGISIRNGPVLDDPMDVDGPATNGASKRKSRSSIGNGKPINYKVDGSGSESDEVPLVCRSSAWAFKHMTFFMVHNLSNGWFTDDALGETTKDIQEESCGFRFR